MLNFIQHNTHKHDVAQHTLLEQASRNQTDVILVQEPALARNKMQGLSADAYICITHPSYDVFTPQPATDLSRIPIAPRVLVYIRKNARIQANPRYDICADPDLQVIEIVGIPEPFLIVNCYNEQQQRQEGQRQRSERQEDRTVNRLLQHIQLDHRQPALIAGDFNAHHPWWNPACNPSAISAARPLAEWLTEHQAVLINDPEVTNEKGTYISAAHSVIDLAFHRGFQTTTWGNWRYLEGTGSDHEVIGFAATPDVETIATAVARPLFNWKKANWEVFAAELQRGTQGLQQLAQGLFDCPALAEAQLDSLAQRLTTAVESAAEASIPVLRITERSKPWWSPELTEQRRALHLLLRRFRASRDSDDEATWKAARTEYFHAVRKAKTTMWQNFLSEASTVDVYRAAKYTKGCLVTKLPALQYDKDGQQMTASAFSEKCEALLTTLFPPRQNSHPHPQQSPPPPSPSPPSQQQQQPQPTGAVPPQKSTRSASKVAQSGSGWDWPALTRAEVEKAISTSSSKSAPGPDRVGYAILKQAYKSIPETMFSVYKTLFEKGYHPMCWRESIGIVLPKLGKRDWSLPKSYRIIALLNCLGKVLEKIVAQRLGYLANTSKLLNDTQLGGRKQRSAIDAAMLLLHYVQQEKAIRKNKQCVTTAVFLDIKGAFDHVSKERLLQILERLGLPGTMRSWVESFLSDRHMQLSFEGQMHERTAVSIGIPQGSPVSPILFIIYVASILVKNHFQLSYMDDFCIAVSSTSAKKNCKQLEKVVIELFGLAAGQQVQFEPEKTELIHFCNKRSLVEDFLQIGDLVVKPKPVVRWLGVFFDSKLTFKSHVEKRLNLATAAFFRIQRLGNTQRGLSFRALRQLYIACISSVADFGVPLWWAGPGKGQSLVAKYQRLQNLAVTRILGAFRGSPHKALELEAALPPPEVRFEKLCDLYSIRILRLQRSHPIKQTYIRTARDELADTGESDGVAYIPFTAPVTQLLRLVGRLKDLVGESWRIEKTQAQWEKPWDPPFSGTLQIMKIPKDKAKDLHENTLHQLLADPFAVVFYTDGSQGRRSKEERTLYNAAATCQVKGLESRIVSARFWNLGPYIEVADAETFAIAQAVHQILQNDTTFMRSATIFSDSQAAIQRLASSGNQFAQLAKQAARKLQKEGVQLTVAWCPSHVGVPGNEAADRLAKAGLKAEPDARYTFVSLSHLRRKARAQHVQLWKQLWGVEETKGLKAKGLGIHYRQVCQDFLDFSLKPTQPPMARPQQGAYIQLKTGIGFLRTHQKTLGKRDDDECFGGCRGRQSAGHLLLYCRHYRTERKVLKKALKGLPLNLQVLLCTKAGKEALAGFLESTQICTAKWLINAGLEGELEGS